MVGTDESVAARTMKPLPVTPEAPLDVSNNTARIVSCWKSVRSVLVACATKSAAMVR